MKLCFYTLFRRHARRHILFVCLGRKCALFFLRSTNHLRLFSCAKSSAMPFGDGSYPEFRCLFCTALAYMSVQLLLCAWSQDRTTPQTWNPCNNESKKNPLVTQLHNSTNTIKADASTRCTTAHYCGCHFPDDVDDRVNYPVRSVHQKDYSYNL